MISILAATLLLSSIDGSSCDAAWGAVRLLSNERRDSVALRDSLSGQPDDCALSVAAYLTALLAKPGSEHWEGRLDAQLRIGEAMRRLGPDARLLMALGYLRYQQGALSEAKRILERGLRSLPEVEPPASTRERAAAAYFMGRVEQSAWRDWRSFGQVVASSEGKWNCEPYAQDVIVMTPPIQGALWAAGHVERASPVDVNVACPAQFEAILDDYFRSNASLKRGARDALEGHFREAIAVDPAYWPPYGRLASELVFEADWGALAGLAAGARKALPHDYRPLLLTALAEYRTGETGSAARMFDSAFALMPRDLSAWYHEPEPVLSLAEERALAAQPATVRERWAEAYWRSRQVSFLGEEGNDRLLEHYARLTESEFLFGIPDLGVMGWNTVTGSAWVRYGRPLKLRDLAIESGRASFWSYGPDPDLVFTRMLTYEEYRVHEHFMPHLGLLHEKVPTRFRPAAVDSVVSLEYQPVRFRGDSGRTDLLVVAGPRERFALASDARVGVTLLDDRFNRVAHWQGRAVPDQGIAMVVRGVRTRGVHSLVVELLDQEHRVLAQARDTIVLGPLSDGLALSDILLAERADGPDASVRRADLSIRHLYGRTLAPGQPLALVWEIYGLSAGPTGRREYRVTVEIRDALGRPLLARLLGSPKSAGTTITYERVVAASTDRIVEWVNLDGAWPGGKYDVTVHVEDPHEGGSASVATWFFVGPASR